MKDLRRRENRELTDMQVSFIENYFRTGKKKESAEIAGYSHGDVAAWKLLQDEKVLDALIEMIRRNQKAEALVGHKVLIELAQDETVPAPTRLKAATEMLDRSGLKVIAQHEHKHIVEDHRSDSEIRAAIASLAAELNIKTINVVPDANEAEDAVIVEDEVKELPGWLE